MFDFGLCHWFYRVFQEHMKAWHEKVANTRIVLLVLAAFLLLVALAVLGLMMFLTLATCFSAIAGDRWDGFVFVMYWVPGFFVFSFVVGFCDPLHAGARAAYDEVI